MKIDLEQNEIRSLLNVIQHFDMNYNNKLIKKSEITDKEKELKKELYLIERKLNKFRFRLKVEPESMFQTN